MRKLIRKHPTEKCAKNNSGKDKDEYFDFEAVRKQKHSLQINGRIQAECSNGIAKKVKGKQQGENSRMFSAFFKIIPETLEKRSRFLFYWFFQKPFSRKYNQARQGKKEKNNQPGN